MFYLISSFITYSTSRINLPACRETAGLSSQSLSLGFLKVLIQADLYR